MPTASRNRPIAITAALAVVLGLVAALWWSRDAITPPDETTTEQQPEAPKLREVRDRPRTDDPAGAASISALVLAPDGTPVSGATLTASPSGRPESTRRARTDADGRARFDRLPAASWSVTVRVDCAAADGKRVELAGNVTREVEFRLRTGHPLAGRLFTDDGRPLVGSRVHVGETGEALVGEGGAFDLGALTAGEHRIWAALPGHDPRLVAIVRVPGVERVDLRMDTGGSIIGVVRDAESGATVADAAVRVTYQASSGWGHDEGRTRSLADGRFEFPIVPNLRVQWLHVTADGYPEQGVDLQSDRRWSAGPPSCATYEQDVALLRELPPSEEDDGTDEPPAVPATLTGRVLDTSGSPLAGAVVWDWEDDAAPRAISGPDGAFSILLPKGAAFLRASDGRTPTSEYVRAEQWPDGYDFRLVAPDELLVTGVVRSNTGAPLTETYVQVSCGDERGPGGASALDRWAGLERFEVAADGTFSMRIPTRPHETHVTVRAGAAGHANTVADTLPIASVRDGTQMMISLDTGRTLRGEVVELGSGAPIAGATILVDESEARMISSDIAFVPDLIVAVTDSAGRFEVRNLAAGVDSIGVASRGHLFAERTLQHDAAELKFELPRAAGISGRIRYPDGSPARFVDVGAEPVGHEVQGADRRGWRAEVECAADGSFRFTRLAPGRYHLEIAEGLFSERPFADFTSDPVATGTTDIDWTLPAGLTIQGRVVGPDGQGLQGIDVETESPSTDREYRGVSEPAGAFSIPADAGHSYRVQVDEPGYLPAAVDDVPAGARGVVIRLLRGLAIRGRLVTAGGAAVSLERPISMWAIPVGEDEDEYHLDRWPRGRAEASGAFEVAGLAEGTYRLVLHRGYSTKHLAVIGDAVAAATDGVDLATAMTVSIEGVVKDAEGKPLEGIRLAAERSRQGRRDGASTEADGGFVIDGMVPGRNYRLEVRSDAWLPRDVEDIAAGRTDVEVVLTLGLVARGRLLGDDGRPLARTEFSLRREDTYDDWESRTDSKGRFEVEGLPAGRYDVRVMLVENGEYEFLDAGTATAGSAAIDLRVQR